jgi:tetratricopeptide (TPR) repeat protein
VKERVQKSRRLLLVSGLLAALTLAAFWPVLSAQFIKLDDGFYVVRNGRVLQGLTWANLGWAFRTGFQASWHPLTWLSHMLDVQLFGLRPWGHHLVNLLLHVANVLLLFGFLRRRTGALWRSALVAGLFAVHPLHVEPVAWISSRKDVLSTLFFLLTLWAYANYAEQSANRATESFARRNPQSPTAPGSGATGVIFSYDWQRWYALSLTFYVLALMSKAMVVSLPFALLLLDFWPLRRITPDGSPKLTWDRSGFRARWPLLREKIPFFALAAVVSTVAYLVVQHGGNAAPTLPLGPRLANAVLSCWTYLLKTFWPAGLTLYYPHPAWRYLVIHPGAPYPLSVWLTWPVVLGSFLLIFVSLVALVRAKREPWLAVGWFWFLLTLAPVSGVVQIGYHAMADRYTYVPLIGIFLALVWQVGEWLKSRSPAPGDSSQSPAALAGRVSSVGGPLGALVLTVCSVLTFHQAEFWRNDDTVFTHALAVTKENAVAHYELGIDSRDRGQTSQAETQFQDAVQADPAYAPAYAELGMMLESRGETNQALALYETALTHAPWSAQIQNHLATMLWRAGRLNEAVDHYWAAIHAAPDDADAHFNLGTCLFAARQWDAAVAQFSTVVRLRPDDADALVSLAHGLLYQGHPALAEERFRQAARVAPNNAEAHQGLAVLAADRNDLSDALKEFKAAVKLRPDWPEALNGLAFILATNPDPAQRNPAEAVRLAERACALSAGSPRFLGTLDTAYAQAGRWEDAIRAATKTREVALSEGQTNLATAAAERLTAYEKQRR